MAGPPSQRPGSDDTRSSSGPDPWQSPRRYLPWVLGASTGLVVCVAGLLVLHLINNAVPSPSATASAICSDLTSTDYASLYLTLTPSLQEQGSDSQVEFTASQRELDIVSGRVTSCSYEFQRSNSAEATVTYLITRGSKRAQSAQVDLVYVDGAWRIQDYDTSMI
ncbi:MAG: hypothetical protein ACLQUY_02255 [Ktedonobacterales bacterium]